jgi:hypothetical protein
MNSVLHKIAFNLPKLNTLFYEFEKTTPSPFEPESILITGLARSGTTSLLNELEKNDKVFSLKYENMPFVLAPKLQHVIQNLTGPKINSIERSHKDGIFINKSSPEAFDEVFFKVNEEKNYHFKHHLQQYTSNYIKEYYDFIKHCLFVNQKSIYLTKNNNHILRLRQFIETHKFKILLTFREPLSHASSLLNQHIIHTKLQTEEPFALQYMNYLGHHEFGLHQKYFLFEKPRLDTSSFTGNDYWLAQWINYYQYILELIETYQQDVFLLVNFNDWCGKEPFLISAIEKYIDLPIKDRTPYKEKEKDSFSVDPTLKEMAIVIYNKLLLISSRQCTKKRE